jgi:glycerol-3-phosphate dehydrogenase
MATTIDDVLSRRTRARLQLRDASADAARVVADLMAAELGWNTDHRDAEVASYVASVAAERSSAGLTVTSRATSSDT